MPWRERETRFEGDENRKRGERADGGVSGWKKRARTERSRRRRRRRRCRPMKKSLVAPAGLANILLSNTRATHTPSPFASPLARPLSVPFLSRGQWRRKRGNERRTGRKSVVAGREGSSRERGRGVALAWCSMKTPPGIFSPRWCRMHHRLPKNFRSLLPWQT